MPTKFLFLFFCSVIVFMFFMNGCKTMDPEYQAKINAHLEQIRQEERPLIDLTLTEDGRVAGIKMYAPKRYIAPPKKDYHPIWRIVEKTAPIIGGIWAAGDALEGIIKAGNGPTTISNSYNARDNLTGASNNNIGTTSATDDNSLHDSNNQTTNTTDSHNQTTENIDDHSVTTDNHQVQTTTYEDTSADTD